MSVDEAVPPEGSPEAELGLAVNLRRLHEAVSAEAQAAVVIPEAYRRVQLAEMAYLEGWKKAQMALERRIGELPLIEDAGARRGIR